MDTDVVFAEIPDFPEYAITSNGEVYNILTNSRMILSPTKYGELTVGLMHDHSQYRRSVKVLVAEAFVYGKTTIFNTPIQLDGNRENLRADNIVWRPRWFAWKYTHQFSEQKWAYDGPVMDVNTNKRYHLIIEAAMIHGLLCEDISESVRSGKRVFPTWQVFSYF